MKFFKNISYPLAFLDYEICPLAIPRFKGYKPYTQIPFQFSLHIMQKDGSVEHNISSLLSIAHRGYVLDKGKVTQKGSTENILSGDVLSKVFVGGAD